MILTVPQDIALYPTLGPQVCDFIEQNLVFGPGDLHGQPMILDDEKQALVYRLYEVYPAGHRLAGRRRFTRCGISLAKGIGKTEMAASVAACELHPEAPVRCTGFTPTGEPIGGPVTDPYIPMVAVNEEQSSELAYEALRVMLSEGPLKDDFDIGLERIMRKKGDGKAVSLSSNPNARDGARTTFSVSDETHRWTQQRLRDAHKVMLNNLPKRKAADPWMLEVTTAFEPGAGSVAEATMAYAESVRDGRIADAGLFYFHRGASDEHDLATAEGLRAAVIEASGPAAEWRDIDKIMWARSNPDIETQYFDRVWLNRPMRGNGRAFDLVRWRELAAPHEVQPGALITLGFDGSRYLDASALVGTEIITGYEFLLGLWERPAGAIGWEVPKPEVDAAVAQAFGRFAVWRMYADPPYWEETIASWAGKYGRDRVVEWWTNRPRQMAYAIRAFVNAMKDGVLTHDGHQGVARHVGNAFKRPIHEVDEEEKPLWTIQKERKDSLNKIDAAMASILSWEARCHAVALGIGKHKESIYESRGALVL